VGAVGNPLGLSSDGRCPWLPLFLITRHNRQLSGAFSNTRGDLTHLYDGALILQKGGRDKNMRLMMPWIEHKPKLPSRKESSV
jgi:hypothetical protein